jgi:hypothetical protein
MVETVLAMVVEVVVVALQAYLKTTRLLVSSRLMAGEATYPQEELVQYT